MISFGILTLGCKVNSYESVAVINDLVANGMIHKEFTDICDVYIVNTCTVTKTSDQKSRQMLHAARRRNKDAIIVAMGCYSQLNENVLASVADIVLGTNNKLSVYEHIKSYLETKKQILAVTNVLDNPKYEEMKIDNFVMHTRAFIKIQDGCENYCSYCAIPYSRGKVRSRNPLNIIEEINNLVKNGTKEVILAGINTGCYGQDLGNINLASLIELIMKETNLYRLRLSSIELITISDELLNILKKYESRIAMHFHIPLQGGSDSVLERMKRKYKTYDYLEVITKIRKLFPTALITTDILAGFVGETEVEFNECIEFIKKINFYDMHVFPYSKRENSVAYSMLGHLDKKVITERAKIISQTAKIMKQVYHESYIGKIVSVLVENKKDNLWKGHTSNYLEIGFESNKENLANKIMNIQIISCYQDFLLGKEVEHE